LFDSIIDLINCRVLSAIFRNQQQQLLCWRLSCYRRIICEWSQLLVRSM